MKENKLCREGLEKKKVAVFLTCGAAITSGRALKELGDILKLKDADLIFSTYVAGNKTNNREYLGKRFKDF